MKETEFWQHIKPFMMVLRQAFLMIVRWIEAQYGLINK